MSGIEFKELSYSEWQAYVDNLQDTNLFYHRNWIELLAVQYNLKPLLLGIYVNGRLSGIPFLVTPTLAGRRKVIALPFTDHLLLPELDAEVWQALKQFFLTDAVYKDFRGQIRNTQRLAGFRPESGDVVHLLNLPSSFKELSTGFSSSLIRNVKKAGLQGLEYETSTSAAAVEDFYRLHLKTRQRQGTPVQPKRFFKYLHKFILEQKQGFVARVIRQQEVIAAAVFLTHKDTIIYKYGASSGLHLALRPNDFLFYHAIRNACESGYHIFDFGSSRNENTGLRKYKSKWGAEEFPVYYNYFNGAPHAALTQSIKMKLLSSIIRKSPGFVCRLVGALFYRYSQ